MPIWQFIKDHLFGGVSNLQHVEIGAVGKMSSCTLAKRREREQVIFLPAFSFLVYDKFPGLGDSEVIFAVFESRCHLVQIV